MCKKKNQKVHSKNFESIGVNKTSRTKTFHRHKRTQIEKHIQKKTLGMVKLLFVGLLPLEVLLSCLHACSHMLLCPMGFLYIIIVILL